MGFFLFALAAIFLRSNSPGIRTGTAVLVAIVGFAVSTLVRNEGMTGEYTFTLRSRWSQTAEDRFLAAARPAAAPVVQPSTGLTPALSNPEWPAFRGADRTSRSTAPRISTNWSEQPPHQIWKTAVGPGWSSFAVAGRLLFTQEQRGAKEAIACYDADSGREIWKTEIDARLDDPMGGPGPRATPTLADGTLYAAGSTGVLLRLNPTNGAIVWKKDLTELSGSKVPMWGFSASPLVSGSLVIAYAGGGDKGLVAFDTTTGDLRWSAPCPTDSYGSPQLNRILGEDSVVILSKSGLQILDPTSGKMRLDYEWKIPQYRALQPHVLGTDTILIPTGMNMGTRAIRISKSNAQFTAEELWTSRNLKPDFVDLVTYEGHVYGNDNGILTCLDLKNGERKWKGGRYGKGQLLLLEKSALLLIAAEDGRVVLVAADPNAHMEVASFKALEGKTWNHPVLIGDRLYVRNSEEAAAYKLPLEQKPEPAVAFTH